MGGAFDYLRFVGEDNKGEGKKKSKKRQKNLGNLENLRKRQKNLGNNAEKRKENPNLPSS